jgi:hypothetical protein
MRESEGGRKDKTKGRNISRKISVRSIVRNNVNGMLIGNCKKRRWCDSPISDDDDDCIYLK